MALKRRKKEEMPKLSKEEQARVDKFVEYLFLHLPYLPPFLYYRKSFKEKRSVWSLLSCNRGFMS